MHRARGGDAGNARRAFGTAEVLIAIAMVAVVVVPLIGQAQQNLRRLREDRLRAVADMLGGNLVGRLGARGPELRGVLTRPDDGGGRASEDVLSRPELASYAKEVGAEDPGIRPLISGHAMSMVLKLRPRIVPGADLLICEVRWTVVKGGLNVEDRAVFERLLVDDTL